MNILLVLLVSVAILVVGYIFYGGWLAKQWGVDDSRPTPAHELEDGVDYVPAPPYVVLGHHFSSIAGAGPINGPIQAAVFGWVPVLLWVLIGGIFFGAMHDFGALFASIRHKGQTIAAVIAENMDNSAKRLFCIFAYLTLILVVAAFASIVANTFADPDGTSIANARTATISVLFILVAIVYGLVTRGKQIPGAVNILSAIVIIIAIVAVGYCFPILSGISYEIWMLIIGVYIFAASIAPVWILLQPRDYLSSYLLYGMILLAVIGILGAGLTGQLGDSTSIPAFTGWVASNGAVDTAGNAIMDSTTGAQLVNKAATTGYLFPALFITIACGAISGFHSLVASGTTSKQIDKESHAKPIAYGGMLLECLVAVIALCAVAFVWTSYQAGAYASPTAIFAGGIAGMIGTILPGIGGDATSIAYSLLILAVSAFCLTSLDTATRLGRYMFQELLTPSGEELSDSQAAGVDLTNTYVATAITVVLGVALGMTGYTIIWPLFGAANQLLAVLALLAVAVWLKNAGRNNKMFYIPMVFMLLATLTSLVLTIIQKSQAVMAGGDIFAPAVQLLLAIVLIILAIVLVVKGWKSMFGKKEA